MDNLEYRQIRKIIGSQTKVAKLLGVSRETLVRREDVRGTTLITREAALALRALAYLPEEQQEPEPTGEPVKHQPAFRVLIGRALAEARKAKHQAMLMRGDLLARPGAFKAVRGPGSARWGFWAKAVERHKQASDAVTVFVRAARAGGGAAEIADLLLPVPRTTEVKQEKS